MGKQYLFICGTARSGTSALTQLLNRLPDVAIGMERYLSRALEGKPITKSLFKEKRFRKVRKGDTYYQTLDFHKSNSKVARSIDSATIVGDKIPRLYEKYENVVEALPEAKFVFIVRQIFDVANSFEKRRLSSKTKWDRDTRLAVKDWNKSISQTLHVKNRFPILVLSYESFFHLGHGLEELAKFLRLDLKALSEEWTHLKKVHERKPSTPHLIHTDIKRQNYIFLNANFSAYRKLLQATKVPVPKAWLKKSKRSPSFPGKYVKTDRLVVDYKVKAAGDTPIFVRGPLISRQSQKKYGVCLGAASTFGRFVNQPYPRLLQTHLKLPVINLGYGGAQPSLYLEDKGLLEIVNNAEFAVIEVMSARGYPNSIFDNRDHHSAFLKRRDISDEPFDFSDNVYRNWLRRNSDNGRPKEVLFETRQAYMTAFSNLLSAIRPPKILFWFSQRRPAYSLDLRTLRGFMGKFPHFVDETMVNDLRKQCDTYVEVVSTKGLPQTLKHYQTGEPIGVEISKVLTKGVKKKRFINKYYPSPTMHEQAALALLDSVELLLS